ncbi:general stress protein [Nodularia sphaerocarpa]|uniref:general stress protein n=1 Tax=Nodularia sphaerocarpa TaxID=137816 RepID=UPI001EFADC2E|nr:general stress protein [Nodularia sphaerocarpa]MDB9373657.1 general stress protein [Nodularia sphaerocarpa CS-585]
MINQNKKYAIGVFARHEEVEPAINELKASGFPLEQVSIIAKDVEPDERLGEAQISDRINDQSVNATKAVGDTLTATTWGSVLVGLSSLAIPGLGVVLAAGSVGVALVASMAGVAVGTIANENLVKALADLGIPENQARLYSDRLQQSNYLLILNGTDEQIHSAEAILHNQEIKNLGIYDFSQAKNH